MQSAEPSPNHQPTPEIPPNSSLSGDSSEPSESHLLIIQDDRGRRRLVLASEMYCIGRDPDCDIRLYSQFVSRRHATLRRIHHEDGTDSYQIVDGSPEGSASANGLMINGRKFQTYDLQNEEEIIFGPQVKAVYYRVNRQGFQE